MIDFAANFNVAQSVVPLLRTATVSGTGADLANVNRCAVVFEMGALTDGTFTPKIQESDASGSGYTDVASTDQVGVLAALTANTTQHVSYTGGKRYVRAVVTVTGSPSTGGNVSAVILRSGLRKAPATLP